MLDSGISKEDGKFYIYGKVENGTLVISKKYTILPSMKKFVIPIIFNSQEQGVPYAKPGENVKFQVKGIKENDVSRGCLVVSKPLAQITKNLEVKLHMLELPETQKIISAGYSCIMHLHTSMEVVTITKIKGCLSLLGHAAKLTL